EKAPVRRYQTAKDLADELQRFLDDRPILARPTTRAEKFARWCRRNPFIAGSIAAVFMALVVALAGVSIGYVRATAARDEADSTATDAMSMVDQLLVRISEVRLLNQPGMQEVRADLMVEAESSYQKLLGKLEKNQRLPEQIAVVQFKMGKIKHYLNSPVEALTLYEGACQSLQKLQDQDPTNMRALKEISDVKTEM